MDNIGTYLELYKEWRGHVRHHETQRSTLTNAFLAFASVAITFLLKEGSKAGNEDLAIGASIALIVTGLVVCAINQKQYELIQKSLSLAACMLDKIDKEKPGYEIAALRAKALDKHTSKERFEHLWWQKLHLLWLILPIIVVGVGGGYLITLLDHPRSTCCRVMCAIVYALGAVSLYIRSARTAKKRGPLA